MQLSTFQHIFFKSSILLFQSRDPQTSFLISLLVTPQSSHIPPPPPLTSWPLWATPAICRRRKEFSFFFSFGGNGNKLWANIWERKEMQKKKKRNRFFLFPTYGKIMSLFWFPFPFRMSRSYYEDSWSSPEKPSFWCHVKDIFHVLMRLFLSWSVHNPVFRPAKTCEEKTVWFDTLFWTWNNPPWHWWDFFKSIFFFWKRRSAAIQSRLLSVCLNWLFPISSPFLIPSPGKGITLLFFFARYANDLFSTFDFPGNGSEGMYILMAAEWERKFLPIHGRRLLLPQIWKNPTYPPPNR